MKNLLLFLSLLFVSGLHAQTTGDYRSIASGDWNVVTNWERFDGATWQPAATAPSSTNGTISVRTPDVITASTAITADQLIVDAGANLIISSAFILANGSGTDLTVNGTIQVGANLSGPGNSSVNGTFDWTAGSISTPLTINATGTVVISGAGAKAINTTVVNNGNINWNGGNVDFNTGSITNNNSFINSFDGSLNNTSGINSFTNTGTFEKSAGTVTNTTIAIPMTNSGTIIITAGTLNKSTNALTLNAGTSFTGNGTMSYSNNVVFNTAVNMPATLTVSHLAGSTATGAGPYTINGTMNWTGSSSISTSCIIAASGVVNALGTGTKVISSPGSLTNNGTMLWSQGPISLSASGIFNNNGTIDMTFDGAMNFGSGVNAFNNAGTFTKSAGTGSSGLNAPVYNSGTIRVNTGTILASAILHLNAGTVLAGNGIFIIDGAVTVDVAVSAPATLTIRKTAGSTTGTGLFTVLGTMHWTGGSIGSPFHFQTGSVLAMASGTSRSLNGTLTNDGTINWSAGSIDFNNGTLINNGTLNNTTDNLLNNTSGTNLLNNTGIFYKSSATGTSSLAVPVTNSGTINVNTGTLVNSSTSFINSGTINILTSRTFSNTGTLMLQTGTAFTGAGNFSNSGLMQLTTNVSLPAALTLNMLSGSSSLGAGVMTVNGTMNWSGGSVGSPFTINATGTVNASGITKSLNNTFSNNGSFLWTAGDISFNNGTLSNAGTITQSFDGTMANTSGTNTFSNAGTFGKTGGTASTINVPATNTGIINGGNTIHFGETFTNNGTIAPGRPMGILSVTSAVSPLLTGSSNLSIEMLNGTGAGVGHDQLLQNSNLVLNGTLTITETGVTPAGDYTIVQLSSGTISGTFTTVTMPASYLLFVNPTNIILRKNILPLNWLSFSGTINHNGIILNWRTANERNTQAFEVQRSSDGRNFTRIGNVKAKGQQEEKAYAFEDLYFTSGMNYYRLKQVDINGAFEYSKTITVRADATANDIHIYPNPAKGTVTIQVSAEWTTADITIRTLSGQLLQQYKNVNQGMLHLELPRGVYLVQFRKADASVIKQLRIN